MEFKQEQREGWLVLHLEGRIDAGSALDFDAALDALTGDGSLKLLLNCENLAYISSAGLRSLLVLTKKLKAGQGRLHFCGLSGMVKEIFEISGFTGMFVVRDTVGDACRD